MATSCDLAAQEVGTGVTAALTAVDCIAGEVSEQAFMRLSEGPMGALLPILLTFFVAFFVLSPRGFGRGTVALLCSRSVVALYIDRSPASIYTLVLSDETLAP